MIDRSQWNFSPTIVCLSRSREPSVAWSSRSRFRPWIWVYSCRMWCRRAYWFDHAVSSISFCVFTGFNFFRLFLLIFCIASYDNSFSFSVVCLILVTRSSTALQLSQCMNLMPQLTEHSSSKVRITFSTFYRCSKSPLSCLWFCHQFHIFRNYSYCSSKEARLQLECRTHNRGCWTREAQMHIFNIS